MKSRSTKGWETPDYIGQYIYQSLYRPSINRDTGCWSVEYPLSNDQDINQYSGKSAAISVLINQTCHDFLACLISCSLCKTIDLSKFARRWPLKFSVELVAAQNGGGLPSRPAFPSSPGTVLTVGG